MYRWLLTAIALVVINAAACERNGVKSTPIHTFSEYAEMQSQCIAAYDELLASSLAGLAAHANARTVSALAIYERLPAPVRNALRNPLLNVDAITMEERLRAPFQSIALCEKRVRNLEVSIFADRLNSFLRRSSIAVDVGNDADIVGAQFTNESLLSALVEAAK